MAYRLLALWLGLILLIIAAPPAKAQTPSGLTMTVQAAFNGNFKFGEWLPIFVTVENTGPDLQAEIQVVIDNSRGQLNYVVPADLPSGARKRFTLYTLPNSFSRVLDVALMQGETELAGQGIQIERVFNDRYVVGVLAADSTGLELYSLVDLPGRRQRPKVISLTLDDIPDRGDGLRLLNTLILNDVDTTGLIPNQQAALTSWVSDGGRLIIGGGAGAVRTLSGLPVELLPVSLNGQQEIGQLPALEAYTDSPISIPGPFLLATADPLSEALTLLAQETTPLVVEQPLGSGAINFVALDLSQAPFNAWAGTEIFAANLLSPGAAWPENLPPDISRWQMTDNQMSFALTNLPALDLPSIRFLGILLAGYIFLIGPVNYLVLRRLDRLAWAWATIPLLTVTFALLSYGIGLGLRGSDIIVNKISVVKLEQDGNASRSRTYVGVFSPNQQDYDIAIDGRSLIRAIGEGYNPWSGEVSAGTLTVLQGEPAKVRGLAVNQWSMQSFVAESDGHYPTGLVGNLFPVHDAIRGRIHNQSDYTWRDVLVFFNGRKEQLGDLAPGAEAEIALDFAEGTNPEFRYGSWWLFQDENGTMPSNRETQFKQNVLDGVIFNNGLPAGQAEPMVIAWADNSPLNVSIDEGVPATQETMLAYGTLPLHFDGEVRSFPPGFTTVETIELAGDAGTCNLKGYFLARGSVEFRLSMPEEARDLTIDDLKLYLMSDGNWQHGQLPIIELYDRQDQTWVSLDTADYGANPITEPERFFDPAVAAMTVRMTAGQEDAPMFGGGCIYYDLSLHGQRS